MTVLNLPTAAFDRVSFRRLSEAARDWTEELALTGWVVAGAIVTDLEDVEQANQQQAVRPLMQALYNLWRHCSAFQYQLEKEAHSGTPVTRLMTRCGALASHATQAMALISRAHRVERPRAIQRVQHDAVAAPQRRKEVRSAPPPPGFQSIPRSRPGFWNWLRERALGDAALQTAEVLCSHA